MVSPVLWSGERIVLQLWREQGSAADDDDRKPENDKKCDDERNIHFFSLTLVDTVMALCHSMYVDDLTYWRIDMTHLSPSKLLQAAINMAAVSTVHDDPFEIIEQLINRVQEIEAALQEAIEFVDKYADVDDGDDGQPIANPAMALQQYLEQALYG